jgi:hypothetical protein
VLLLLRQRREVELPVHFRRGGVGWGGVGASEVVRSFRVWFGLKLSRGS